MENQLLDKIWAIVYCVVVRPKIVHLALNWHFLDYGSPAFDERFGNGRVSTWDLFIFFHGDEVILVGGDKPFIGSKC